MAINKAIIPIFAASSIFVITYVGGSIPESNSVSIIIDYGDGSTADSGPHNFNISSTGASKQIQHVYTSDNTFNAQVTVFSDCCSVINNVTVSRFYNMAVNYFTVSRFYNVAVNYVIVNRFYNVTMFVTAAVLPTLFLLVCFIT